MLNYEINEQMTDYMEMLSRLLPDDRGLWSDEIDNILSDLNQDFSDVDTWLGVLNRTQILTTIITAGLQHSAEFKSKMDNLENPLWSDFVSPPVSDDLQNSLVDKIYPKTSDPSDKFNIIVGDHARFVGRRLVENALKDGVPFNVNILNPNFSRLIYNHVDEDGLQRMSDDYIQSFDDVTKRLSASPILPDIELIDFDTAKQAEFSKKTKVIGEKTLRGDIFFTLTKIPSRKDAEVDGQDYEDYVKLFFEMCDQPWDHIDKAHRKLIEKLNTTKELHFRNDDGTDLTMELVDHDGTHFTFANSLIAKNVPGSEVFSAPRLDSVNGTIVAKGQFNFISGKIIKDLTLHFKDGYLESFEAAAGAEHFKEFLDRDEGNRYVGEIGIGTNPHLKEHVLNSLLVEKIGGSFHVALGQCYTMTDYEGEPVKVDNGNNKTSDHWDITTMLYGKGGTIEADGELIMKDGKFVDPDLAVLNQGWAAVPVSERPEYWKDFKGYDVPPSGGGYASQAKFSPT